MNPNNEKIVVLTGAGISAESGIATFRDAGGLWEGHDVMEVASPEGWANNPALVLDFYNRRRQQLKTVSPNPAHLALAHLAEHFEVVIITQNVDDLHERAGSKRIIHLHGELRKARSTVDHSYIVEWEEDILEGQCCPQGGQMRPHIVWFGETVPEIPRAIQEMETATKVLIIGTSMQVYPAAGLIGYAPPFAPIYYVDPNPSLNWELQHARELSVIDEPASVGVPELVDRLMKAVVKKK